MHFGAISGCEQDTDLVAGPIKLGRLAAGCAVKEIDHAPSNVLGIGLQGRVGKHREKIGPDCSEGLLDRILAGKVGLVEGGWPDAKAREIETVQLVDEAVVHGVSPDRGDKERRHHCLGPVRRSPIRAGTRGVTHRVAGNLRP